MIYAGNPITASTVNSANNNVSLSYSLSSGTRIDDVIGNSGIFYSHRQSGTVLVTVTKSGTGMYDMGIFTIQRYVSNAWTDVGTIILASSSTSGSVNSQGPGQYKIAGEIAGSSGNVYLYCGQNNIQVNQKVISWDNFLSSLNKARTGQAITASLANQTYIGGEN